MQNQVQNPLDQQNQQVYTPQGKGLVKEYNQGPVKLEDRKFQDGYCIGIFALCFILLIIFLGVSAGEFNDLTGGTSGGGGTVKIDMFLLGMSVAIFFIALFLAIAFTYFTPHSAGCIIWGMIGAAGLTIVVLAIISFASSAPGLGVFMVFVFLIYALIIYCRKEKIAISIVIIKSAAIFVTEHMNCLLISTIFSFLYLVFLVITVLALIYSYYVQIIYKNEGKSTGQWDFFIIFEIVMYYWVNNFVSSLMVVSLSFYICAWFFSYENKVKDEQKCFGMLSKSLMVSMTKHIGSISLGAFIIALCEILKDVADNMMKSKNPISIFIGCLLNCIVDAVRHLTKAAFIMMALTGESFCVSAKDGFHLIMKKFGTYVTLQFVGSLYASFGCLFVAFLSATIGFLAIDSHYKGVWQGLQVVFLILYFFVGYCVALMFLHIILLAADCCLFYMTVDKLINGELVHGPKELYEVDLYSRDPSKYKDQLNMSSNQQTLQTNVSIN